MNPNILHTIASISVNDGGPPRSVSQLCTSLSNPSNALSVHLLTKSHDLSDTVPIDPAIRLHTVCTDVPVKESLKRIHSEYPLAIIHQHSLWNPFLHQVATFAYRNKIPFVMTPRGTLQPWSLSYRRWKKCLAMFAYQRRDLQRASLLHATALAEAESIRAQGLRQPILISPNGVELPAEEAVAPHVETAETRTALFLSRIHPKKGLEQLLHAWQRVAAKGWVLQIAGNDEIGYQAQLEQLCRQLGLGDSVRFLGPLWGEQKIAAYHNADLFVLPSFSENFGIVIAEALGHGLPVITTRGCPWEELQTEDCGWWIEMNEDAIADALVAATGLSAGQRRQMGLRGRALIQRKYQWDAIGADVTAAYRWLLGKGNKPDSVIV